ncbi:hypothetical protein [Paenibacillus thalictri]|uniref:PepSY domain-containing protein n=1 Tax=Paenibacillus thalictri TaxID=2527873 RepID=A0A4Q9DCA6_9BACL|nr:hypothetical protein [Paenibacillus thalictri]TBL67980.1 hypothetical protein EYB31_38890 [Paenibacillus thalictri]
MKRKYGPIFMFTLLLILSSGFLASSANADQAVASISSFTQAEDYAKKLIAADYPFAKDQIVLDLHQEFVLNQKTHYSLYFKRMIGNVPYPNNKIFYAFDETGKRLGHYIYWDKQVQFEKQEPVLNKEDVKAQFLEHMQPLLSYWFNGASSHSRLTESSIYSYDFDPEALDFTLTGEPYNLKQKLDSIEDENSLAGETANIPIKPIETEKEALKHASLVAGISNGPSPEVRMDYNTVFNDRLIGPFWQVIWVKSDSCYARTVFQQNSGQLVDYWNACMNQSGKSLTTDLAKQKAIQLVKQYLPESTYKDLAVEDVSLLQKEPEGYSYYSVKFVRHISGVWNPNLLYVDIDEKTGSFIGFSNQLNDYNYESLPVVDNAKLNKMLLDKYDLELRYEAVNDMKDSMVASQGGGWKAISEEPVEISLVYHLIPKAEYSNYFLDAKEAVWRDRNTAKMTTKEQIEMPEKR